MLYTFNCSSTYSCVSMCVLYVLDGVFWNLYFVQH